MDDKDKVIDAMWENSNHGTKREDVVRAYEAGSAAERKQWVSAATSAIEALEYHASSYCKDSVPKVTVEALAMLRKISEPNAEINGQTGLPGCSG